jgi:calcineurin-like phosphoesterase family protein/2'-5' RNA ligase
MEPGKAKLKASILAVKSNCRIPSHKTHRVPHVTLYGPFHANREQVERVKEAIISVGRCYSFLPYLIDGFDSKDARRGKLVFFKLAPSREFDRFREELTDRLLRIVPDTMPYDRNGDFLYHSTLAYKLTDAEFRRIWSYVTNKKSILQRLISVITGSRAYYMRHFYLPMNVLRITLLDDRSRIICEYDLLQKRLLGRSQALDRREWQRTLKLFRTEKGAENYAENAKSTYLISDLHLDHAKIIEYCARPFSNVGEMNNVLVDNWNNTVRDNPVFFLGDMCYGRGSRPAEYWLGKLRGELTFIKGDHDVKGLKEYHPLEHQGYKFYLVHDPVEAPPDWGGWVIHGHKHNNDMKEYPFINGDRRTINVSAELVNYHPVSLDFLISLKLDSIKRMDTVDSVPQRQP